MSTPTPDPSHGQQSTGRHPAVTVLMVIFGLILLAPGICSVFFIVGMGAGRGDPALILLWIVCFAISFGGIWLLRSVMR
jgi:hypothetical protein